MSITPITDVSHWQGLIRWSVASGYVKAVIAKTTEAISLRDTQWVNNKNGCLAVGLPFGAYHFFRPNVDPIQQAKFYLDTVGNKCNVFVCDLETPLLAMAAEMASINALRTIGIDPIKPAKIVVPPGRGQTKWTVAQTDLVWRTIGYEHGYSLSVSPDEVAATISLPDLAEAFCDYILANRSDARVGIYTSPYFWKTFMRRADGTYPMWTNKYFLWIAHYYVTTPIIPAPWDKAQIHQYTDKLVIPGIDCNAVDGDWFYGDEGQCREFFGNAGAPIDPEPPTDIIPDSVTVSGAALNLRSEPTSIKGSLTVIGTIVRGKVLYPEGVVYDASGAKWWKLGRRIYCAAWLTK